MTVDDNAAAVIAEGRRRGVSERGIEIALTTMLVESDGRMLVNAAHQADADAAGIYYDGLCYDGESDGLFQQQPPWWGTLQTRMDPTTSAGMFYDALAKLNYDDPSVDPGWFAAEVQNCRGDLRWKYSARFADGVALYNHLIGPPPPVLVGDVASNPEHVLPYDHSVTPQQTPWDCGPASAQIVLNGRGVIVDEMMLVSQIGTNTGGTNDISMITPVLNSYLPDAQYDTVYMRDDPPTSEQVDQLWANLTRSINNGYGLVMNIVAPPSNYPRGVKGSTSPRYGGGTIWHYIACMGYDDAVRAVWIADSGFVPYGYWCDFQQVSTLIPPKGYCYARGST